MLLLFYRSRRPYIIDVIHLPSPESADRTSLCLPGCSVSPYRDITQAPTTQICISASRGRGSHMLTSPQPPLAQARTLTCIVVLIRAWASTPPQPESVSLCQPPFCCL